MAFGARPDIDFLGVDEGSVRLRHNFFDIDPFLMIFAPFESCHRELSNGAKFIKKGSILKKLQIISGNNFSRPWPK